LPRGEFDRSARREQTRDRLLAAAARVYARSGFNGATLDDVAAEAGFTKGAVYGHFGSKENLLVALVDEFLSEQIAEQISLIDRTGLPWERPIRGADVWIAELRERPDPFRLFVEFWVHAQRDERLRAHLAGGLDALRQMFVGFATDGAADGGTPMTPEAIEGHANVALGTALGFAMMTLADPDAVAPHLLGAALSIFIQACESSQEVRDRLAAAAVGGQVLPLRTQDAQ
jgi:AcrR family transcriptional regulator